MVFYPRSIPPSQCNNSRCNNPLGIGSREVARWVPAMSNARPFTFYMVSLGYHKFKPIWNDGWGCAKQWGLYGIYIFDGTQSASSSTPQNYVFFDVSKRQQRGKKRYNNNNENEKKRKKEEEAYKKSKANPCVQMEAKNIPVGL